MKKLIKAKLNILIESRRIDFNDYDPKDAQEDANWLAKNILTLKANKGKIMPEFERLTKEVELLNARINAYEEDLNILKNKFSVEV
jgi:peptidoglycan hydrolase CwlO-like protein